MLAESRTARSPAERTLQTREAGAGLPRVALVHDYLSERGGAERVAISLTRAFPDAPLYTSVFDAPRYPELADHDIRTTVLNRSSLLRHHHRVALPLLSTVYGHLQPEGDVVICSSSGWAHGVRTDAPKIVYCHNPARWLYQRQEYGETKRRYAMAATVVAPYLRRWDRKAASTAHRYLANSSVVAERIRDLYGVWAEVLPPPTTLDVDGFRRPIPKIEPGFVLLVGRLLGYKHVGEVVEAFKLLTNQRLVVIGDGPQRHELERDAPRNVSILGRVDEAELRWAYANCSALVSASHEDFGLTPVEAGLYGKPSALLRAGGFLDTTVEGVNGLFFEKPEPWSIAEGVRRVLAERWKPVEIATTAARFSEAGFAERLREIVAEVLDDTQSIAVA